jgi:hypothetical protein
LGDNSQFAFSQHVCPHDVAFKPGTWFIDYYLAGSQQPSGIARFNIGWEKFQVALGDGSADTCSEVTPGVPCLVAEQSHFGKDFFKTIIN